MLQLTPGELKIFELLRAGMTYQQISLELGIKKPDTIERLNRMMDFGAVKRTGNPKRYVYSAVDLPYEVVKRRNKDCWNTHGNVGPDTLLEELITFQLTDEQKLDVAKHRDNLSRSALAAKLQIPKLHLNIAMDRL
ncbi:hypothetical protein HQN90_20295 [Paenibacillus alba]|uniref:helix-turn-helix transcriptional regulator n=1 Tax=Paenibacillus alba TaxID=1197127 RepID=UPI001565D974|nr:hypothetical protein [Paenibacillus alba]NQX68469.1 hypothetical protein [Paenibacillus alba]